MTQPKNILGLQHQLVGPYSIIKELRKVPLNSYDLPVHVYAGRISSIDKLRSIRPGACGVGLSDREALSAFLGEAVERYSWLSLSPEGVVLSTESHLSEEFIPVQKASFLIRRDLLYDEVFSKLKTVKIPWLEGKSLLDNRKVMIPVIDFFPCLLPEKQMEEWTISTTSGIAAGDTFASACLSAIYEVIERDAVMQFWYFMKDGRQRYPIKKQCEAIDQILNKCAIMDLRLDIVDITTDLGTPCAFTYVYRGEMARECFACGAACRLLDREAAKKSLLEAVAMWNSLSTIENYRHPLKPSEASLGFANINNFEDHVFLYTHPWAKHGYEFLVSGPFSAKRKRYKHSELENKSPEERLEFLVTRLLKRGYETFILDITPDDIKGLGLHVVRAIIPNLVPLSVGKYAPFHVNRFCKNGQGARNKWPHPLP